MGAIDQLRGAGFSDDQVTEWVGQTRQKLSGAGFDNAAVNDYLGIAPDPQGVPQPFIDRANAGAQINKAFSQVGNDPDLVAMFGLEPTGDKTVAEYLKHVGKEIYEGAIQPFGKAFERGKAGQPLVPTAELIPAGLNAAMMFGLKMGGGKAAMHAPAGEPIGRGPPLPNATVGDMPITRLERDHDGTLSTTEVGGLPKGQDITTAAKTLTGGERNVGVENKISRIYEELGVTPAEVAHDAQHDPMVMQSLLSDGTDLPAKYVDAKKAIDSAKTAEAPPFEPTFKTAQGSEYQLHEDGTTTRNKAARDEPGHEGDFGLKDRSEKTVYLTDRDIQALAPPEGSEWRIIDHRNGNISLAVKNADGSWGISRSQRNIRTQTEPGIGLHPLEMWQSELINGLPAFKKIHPGNAITEMGGPPSEPPPPGTVVGEIPPEAPGPPPDPPKNLAEAVQRILSKISIGERGPKEKMTFDKLYTRIVDEFNPLSIAQKAAAEGREVPISEDFYKLARLTRGTFGKADHFLRHGTFDFNTFKTTGPGLETILAPVKENLDGFRAYIAAKRALEMESRSIASGIDLDAARIAVEKATPEFKKAQAELVAYQNELTRYLKDSGVLSEEGYKAMLELNKDYVPFFRLMEKKTGPSPGKSFGPGNPIHKLEGSERPIIDPLESIMKNTYALINIADRNAVGRALIDALKDSGEGIIEKVGEEPARGIGDNGAPEEFRLVAEDFQSTDGTKLSAYKDGAKESYKSNDPELIKAFQQLDSRSINFLLKLIAAPARALRAGATLTPDFMARNLIRDFQTMFINTAKGIATPIRTAKGLVSVIRKDADFLDWLKSGGANSALVSMDRRYLQQNLERLNQETGFMNAVWNIVRHPIESLRVLSELSENATRVGEFKAELKGKERTKEAIQGAGYVSREITLDFSRIGANTRAYNMITAFANANIQGIDRFIRAARDRPVRTTLAVAGANVIPSMLLWSANHDDPRYKAIPQWQKDLFWIIMTKDHIYRIPKDFGVGVFFGSGTERILEATVGKNPDAFKNFKDSLMQAFLPSVMPTIALPLVEQFANRSTFTDRTLIPQQMEDWVPEYQATPYTTQLSQTLGRMIGALPVIHEERMQKGSPVRAIVSPILMENYLRAWTGNLGQYALQASDAVLRKAGVLPDPPRPADTLSDIPFIKAFTVRYPSASAQQIQDFYDNYEKSKIYQTTFQAMAKEGNIPAMQAIQQEGGPAMFVKMEALKKTLSTQSQLIRNITKNPDPKFSPDQRRQMIDSLYYSMIKTAEEGNRVTQLIQKAIKR